MDKLKAMATFVRIADAGSLTAAAGAMNCSLPAVVRSLAALEATLRTRLFNRTTRRISLTEEGRRYLLHCRAVLAAIDEAEADLGTDAGEPTGTVHLAAPVLFGQLHVAPSLLRFIAGHTGMRVRMHLGDRVVDLLEQGLDVGVRIGHLPDSSLVARPVGELRRVLVASPAYLRRHGTPDHPTALRSRNCLCQSGLPGWTFFERAKPIVVQVSGNFECSHVAPLVEACLQGEGLGLFMSYQVADAIAAKSLRIVLAGFEPPPRPLQIVYPHARLLPSRVKALVEWLRADLPRHASWAALNPPASAGPRGA